MTEVETITDTKQMFKIETMEDFRRVMVIADGGNPDAQQAVVDFMNLKSTTERANFMDKTTMLAVAQQDGLSENYPMFKSFGLVSRAISSATMGWKSKKSDQLVQIIQQTPNLGDLTSASDDIKQGFVDKILGRGKKE